MKKLALLLFFCAMAFAPLANAQDCSWAGISCSGHAGCEQCHAEVQICGENPGAYCYDCYTPCLSLEDRSRAHAVLPKRPIAAPGHTPLTDLGAAFLAAVMPDFLRNPLAAGRLPKGHPEISEAQWERQQARMKARNQIVTAAACKAPASIQLLTASMLRK